MNPPMQELIHSTSPFTRACVCACARNRNQIQDLNSVKRKCSKWGVSFFTFSIIYSRVMGFQTEKSTESFIGHRLEETWSLFVESQPWGFRDEWGMNFIPESSTPAPTKKLPNSRGRTLSSKEDSLEARQPGSNTDTGLLLGVTWVKPQFPSLNLLFCKVG